MKIWTVTTDGNCGHECNVYTEASKAESDVWDYLNDDFDDEENVIADNLSDALEYFHEGEGFIFYEVHEIPDTPIIASAKAQMADLIHQIEQMKGMFSDDDGRIQQAIDDAEAWPSVVEDSE